MQHVCVLVTVLAGVIDEVEVFATEAAMTAWRKENVDMSDFEDGPEGENNLLEYVNVEVRSEDR